MQPTPAMTRHHGPATFGAGLRAIFRRRGRPAAPRIRHGDLATFDDRMLRDVGLRRDMLPAERVMPFRWID